MEMMIRNGFYFVILFSILDKRFYCHLHMPVFLSSYVPSSFFRVVVPFFKKMKTGLNGA